ncbi:MAG: YidC/Oxa1 family insertase periplasmic-domain containing protein [Phycisphaeraceae bacterium]|nr:YidC/Oxa1 family insertase periplasmic-domain containing protein [Phycisphaeraceae bacterium]
MLRTRLVFRAGLSPARNAAEAQEVDPDMALAKNPVLRLLVPVLIVAGLGGAVFFSLSRGSPGTGAAAKQPAAATRGGPVGPAEATPTAPAAESPSAQATPESGDGAARLESTHEPVTESGTAEQPSLAPPPNATPPPPPGVAFAAEVFRDDPAAAAFDPIGSLDTSESNHYKMEIRFANAGASIESIRLTDSYETIAKKEHDLIQQQVTVVVKNGSTFSLAPMAALSLQINGSYVSLFGKDPIWRQTAPGRFEAFIIGGDGKRAARLTRAYVLEPGTYGLRLDQRVENLTGEPMSIRLFQYGPMDLPRGTIRYGGDVRRVRLGYTDTAQRSVQTEAFLTPHADVVGKALDTDRLNFEDKVIWPNERSDRSSWSLVWFATTNRYFATAMYPLVPQPVAGGPPSDRVFRLIEKLDRYVVYQGDDPQGRPIDSVVLRITTPEMNLAAGQSADLSAGIYAGPLSRRLIDNPATPDGALRARLQMGDLVIYTFGGPCAMCTFQWLTYVLRGFLGFLHDRVLFDWSLAIIVLVVCVRTILHPVTKWSQSNIQRFSKKMQSLAPKQRAIQEKYKNDPKKRNEELSRLMREEGINPAGMLGCLPMFLQTPVWIALFAMLYFTYELRHQPAFFGVFQAITGGRWGFLADLSEPDHFISLGISYNPPLIGSLMGPIESINLLPLVLGLVFYFHQKYMSPPTSGTLTPEQEQQQKIMKVMSVVMFPLFMYNMPSGLTLYTMTNSILGIFESRHIRAQVEKEDAARAERMKQLGGRPDPKPKGGFLARMQERIEMAQKRAEQLKAQRDRQQRK